MILNTLLTFFLVFSINYCAAFNYPQLELLTVVFRHGNRDTEDGPLGDLTREGKQKAYHLGEVLRAKYGDFLGDIYEPATVFAQSTAYNRAKLSLQLLLAALYVPQKHQRWHESLGWQPIPFSYSPMYNDIVLMPTNCPRFKEEYKKVISLQAYQNQLNPFHQLLNNLTILTKQPMKDAENMFDYYHKLVAIQAMNQSLPYWINDIFPNGTLLNGTYLHYDTLKYTVWMNKVNGGSLIRKIVDDMINKIDNNMINKRKLFLYSTHELILVAFMQTIEIWKGHIPEYSSAFIIELREYRKRYYVKVINYDGISRFKEIQVPGCPSLCPVVKFIEQISDRLPNDDEMICDEKFAIIK